MNGGGAERVMLMLANELSKRDFSVSLLLNQAEGSYLKFLSNDVKVVSLNSSRVLTSIVPLVKYFKKERPMVIISAMNFVNIVTLFAKQISGIEARLILSEHNNLSQSISKMSWFKRLVFKGLMSFSYKRSSTVVAVSRGVADDLISQLNISPSIVETIYNPIFTPEIIYYSQAPIQHPWLNDDSIPVVLGVGRLVEQKDFETLILSFSKVVAEMPCRLVILGEGSLRPQLEALVTELGLSHNIFMPGFVDNPYAWMSKVDLFVLSSIYEGFGNVLVEAMACGSRVVSTDCLSGPSEILENGKWGALVPIKNTNIMSQAIIEALSNPVDGSLLERASVFSVENSIREYIKIMID